MSEDRRERTVFRPTSAEVRILDAGNLPKQVQVWLQLIGTSSAIFSRTAVPYRINNPDRIVSNFMTALDSGAIH